MDVSINSFRAHAHYNGWFNSRLYRACEQMSDQERKRDRGAFFKSIHATLSHLVWADKVQLARFAVCGPRFRSLSPGLFALSRSDRQGVDLYDNWMYMRQAREETDLAIVLWTHEIDTAFVEARMRYTNSVGDWRDHPVWFGMAHFFNHQAHHRGQVTTLLKQAGIDPGSTDFMDLASEFEFGMFTRGAAR